jgi:insulin receptor substrate 1
LRALSFHTDSLQGDLFSGVPAVRDRCDSLPSRARTTSEGHPSSIGTMAVIAVQQQQQQHHHQQQQQYARTGHLVPHVPRPHSMHSRMMSYSPPVASIPINPTSAACSTDSAGSSLSMDDASENIMEEGMISKYGHSLTPDEPVILEENADDYVPWSATHQQKYSPNFKSCSPSQVSLK